MIREDLLDDFNKLLSSLEQSGVIRDITIETKAQLVPAEKLHTTFSFEVVSGITMAKSRKLKQWITDNYPDFVVKTIYHKHRVVVYYKYESD